MRPVFALAVNDLRLLVRDKVACFFTLFFPIMIAIFFGAIFGGRSGTSKINLAIVNEDGGAAAAAFVADLQGTEAFNIKPAQTREQGLALVRKGNAAACVILPQGFQKQADNMLAGDAMKIEGFYDPSRQAESGLITGRLNEIAYRQMQKVFTDTSVMRSSLDRAKEAIAAAPDMDPAWRASLDALFAGLDQVRQAQETEEQRGTSSDDRGFRFQPVSVTMQEVPVDQNKPSSSYELSFPQGIIWGLMGVVMAFGAGLAIERARGTLVRLIIAPISRFQVLAAKGLACFIACLAVQLILLVLGVLVFRVTVRSPGLMATALLLSSFGFVGVMMAVAGLSRTEGGAQGVARAIVLVLAMIGGGTVPLFILPQTMQTLSGISPFRWTLVAIEGAIWRGYTMGDMLLPVAVLAGIGIVGTVIGALAMRWQEGA